MRLLMVVHGSFPQDVRVAREARALREAGWEVDVVATTEGDQPARERVDGVDVHRIGVRHRHGAPALAVVAEYVTFTLLASFCAARLMRKRRYRIVHVHNPPDFLVAAAVLPRLLGARIVLDIHDLAPDMFAMRFAGRPGSGLADSILRWVERMAVRSSDLLVTVHEPYRRTLIDRGAEPRSTIVVMNAVDERILPPRPTVPAEGFRAVYHGTVTPHYGVHLLVEAAAQVHREIEGFRAEIYGAGDAVASLRQLAERREVTDVVAIDGVALPQAEVLRRVAGAQAGVIPNLATRLNRYALSTKLFEYVALRIPVVCAGLPTLREHFAEDEVIFFSPGDAAELAGALRSLADDPAAAAERAERAAARASAYSWTENARRLLDAIDALAARQPQ